MKKLMKKSLAVILALMLLSGSMVCLAAAPADKELDYKSYVLLGDSIASGWSDVEDIESRFVRVEGSYGAYVADDLDVEEYYPMACIGFRTVEMRYILEEDYEPDRFLYYSIEKELMDTVYAPAMREAITNADLITLNIGGNDWGSFLGWHVFEEVDKAKVENEQFLTELKSYLENPDSGVITFDTVIEIAAYCNALPTLAQVLPLALEEGLSNYFTNWNYMIEDIYAYNPDVTLLVIGMFDNSLQDPNSDKVTVNPDEDPAITELKRTLGQTVCDIANTPMIEGAKKYGYIFVDTTGTYCEEYHPSRTENGGHRYIADRILEALPDTSFAYTDVAKDSAAYNAIEYLVRNGIMEGRTETTFAPDEVITAAELEKALFAVTGKENIVTKADSAVSRVELGVAMYRAASELNSGIMGFIKAITLFFSTVFEDGAFGFASSITRAQAAMAIMDLLNK